MSSTCSSPQYSPGCSSRSPTGPLSPQSAITMPSSCNSSPKLESSNSFPSPPLSPREKFQQRFYTTRQSQSPPPPEPLSAYAYPSGQHQLLPPSPISPSIQAPYTREPSAYDEAVNFYLYSPLSPTSIYYEWPLTTLSVPEYSPWTDYSGYPPASAFYGPLPFESAQQEPSSYDSMMVDPLEYKTGQLQAADGRRVEYSAAPLQRAIM